MSDDERRQLVSAERDARAAAETALAALAKIEARYRSIAETTTEWMWACDVEGRLTYSNAAVESILGYPVEELLGRNSFELMHADQQNDVLAIFRECLEKKTGWSGLVIRWIHKDGSYRYLESNGVPDVGPSGDLEGFRGSDRDVTERVEAEEKMRGAEERYRNLIEELPLVTYIRPLDMTGANMYVSPQVEALLGYLAEEWETDAALLARIVHPVDRERVLSEAAHVRQTGKPLRSEYRCVRPDGRVVWVRDETRLVRDESGKPLYVQGYLIDITERRAAEQALRDSEERFRTLVSNLPGAIYRCACDSDWTMEFVSEEVEAITGYPPSDFLGRVRSFASVIHPEDRGEVEHAVLESVREKRSFVLEYRVVTADGGLRWVYEKGQGVLGPDGEALWIDGAIFDVTERKEVEAERERLLERLVEAERITHLGSWSWDVAANNVTWSDEMFRIWGLDPDRFDASYEAYLETVHPDDRAFVKAQVEDALATGGFDYECRIVRRDGGERFLHARAKVLYDEKGAPVTMIGTTLDITERKEIEAERERLLTKERAQNARLRELDRLKDTFVASVSHELRTPLTSISGFLQLMQDGLAGKTTEEQRRCLAIAGRNADRLHRLIGDLLFVAQMDAGQLVLEAAEVDLRALAEECLESARPRAMQAGVEVVLEGDAVARLQGDPSRLNQLLDNLVSNAIKFSSEGGRVVVRTRSENGGIVIEVADQGIGIPADQQQHLFQRFFRGSNAAERAIQGTGIGLSIVNAIVDAHGGSITVESHEGAGTTFRVAFPLRMPPVATRPKRVEAA